MSVKPEPSFRRILRYADVDFKNAQVMSEAFFEAKSHDIEGDYRLALRLVLWAL